MERLKIFHNTASPNILRIADSQPILITIIVQNCFRQGADETLSKEKTVKVTILSDHCQSPSLNHIFNNKLKQVFH